MFRSGGSKSIFSSLLLANYEQQLHLDTTANYSSNLAFDNSREFFCTKYERTKTGIPAKETNASALEEDEESHKTEKNCEPPVSVIETGILLNVDPFVSKLNAC